MCTGVEVHPRAHLLPDRPGGPRERLEARLQPRHIRLALVGVGAYSWIDDGAAGVGGRLGRGLCRVQGVHLLPSRFFFSNMCLPPARLLPCVYLDICIYSICIYIDILYMCIYLYLYILYMYIYYMYIYILYVCIYIHTHTHTHTYIHTYMHTSTSTYTYTYTYTCT